MDRGIKSKLENNNKDKYGFFSYVAGYASKLVNRLKFGEIETDKDLDYISGYETVLHNPDRFLDLNGVDLRFYDRMLEDEKIKSVIELKKRLILAPGYDFISPSEDKEDEEITEDVKSIYENLGWNGTDLTFREGLRDLLDALQYGFKVQEEQWNLDEDKRPYISRIVSSHPVYFDFAYKQDRSLNGLVIGRYYGDEKFVEEHVVKQKFAILIYPYPKNGNFYGESELDSVFHLWTSKTKITQYRNEYLESFQKPIPKVVYDASKVDADEKNAMDESLQNFHNNKYFLVPGFTNEKGDMVAKFDIELLETSATRNDQYNETIQSIDRQIARDLLLPDKLGFSDSDGGSYSLSETQFDILKEVLLDYQKMVEKTINVRVRNLVDLRYGSREEYPTFKFNKMDKEMSKDMLELLINAKVVDPREKWIRNVVGAPELTQTEEDEIEALPPLTPAVPEVPAPAAFNKKKNPPINLQQAENSFTTIEEETESELYDNYKAQIDNIVKQVQKGQIVEKKDRAAVDKLKFRSKELNRIYKVMLNKGYFMGRRDEAKDLEPRLEERNFTQTKLINPEDLDFLSLNWVRKQLLGLGELGTFSILDREALSESDQKAYYYTGNDEAEIIKKAGVYIYEGIDNGFTVSQVVANIKKGMIPWSENRARTNARTLGSLTYNKGRKNSFEHPAVSEYVESAQYDATIDQATTDFCRHHNEQIISKTDPMYDRINPPNHFQCRSLLVPILEGDNEDPDSFFYKYDEKFESWGTGDTDSTRLPASGFGGGAK